MKLCTGQAINNVDQIPTEFWWLAVCLNTILIPAGSALGAWLLYRVWPVFAARMRDNQEYRQEIESKAFQSSLQTNDKLVDNLIETNKIKFSDVRLAIEAAAEEVIHFISNDTRLAAYADILQHLESIHRAINRQNDLFTVLNINISEIIDYGRTTQSRKKIPEIDDPTS